MKNFWTLVLLLSVIICPKVEADSLKVYSNLCDMYWSAIQTSYANTYGLASASDYGSNTLARIGQWEAGVSFYIREYVGSFDTSPLTGSEIIDSVVFQFYCDQKFGTSDSICLVEHVEECTFLGSEWNDWIEYGDPPDHYLGAIWMGDITADDVFRIKVDPDSFHVINDAGLTEIGLRSWEHVDSIPPGDESSKAIEIRTADWAGTDYDPYVVIYYAPAGTEAPDSIKAENEDYAGFLQDLTPELKCRYNQTEANSDSVWWQVGTTVGDSNMWNSDWQNISEVSAGSFIDEISYDGSALSRKTWYYVRAKTMDTDELVSGWSDTDSFRVIGTERVYVGLMVDTEGSILWTDFHPTIHFSSWHSGTPNGAAWEVMQKTFREDRADIFGGLPTWTWLCILAEPYDSATGVGVEDSFETHWDALLSVYDTLWNIYAKPNAVWDDSGYNDEIAVHYHWCDWCSNQWYYGEICTGDEDDYDTLEFKRYMAALLYEKHEPNILLGHRGGWNRQWYPLHDFLNNWIFLDPSNVVLGDPFHPSWSDAPDDDTTFRPYHPSDTNWQYHTPIHEKRIITGIVSANLWDATATNYAWDLAADEGASLAMTYIHNDDNMVYRFNNFYIQACVKESSTAIPFVYGSLSQIMRWYHGWTDSAAPVFTFADTTGDSVQVRVSGETAGRIFNPAPFGVVKTGAGGAAIYPIIALSEHDDSTWWFNSVTYPRAAKFAVVDTCANTSFGSITLEMIRPDGDGYYTTWYDFPTAGDDWEDIDETIPDDADYIYTYNSNARSSFTFANPVALKSYDTIDSITVQGRAKEAVQAQMRPFLRIAGTDYNYATSWDLTSSYKKYVATWATNPADSEPFTLADLNSIEAGVTAIDVGLADEAYLSQFRIVIFYTTGEPEEGWASLLLKRQQRK